MIWDKVYLKLEHSRIQIGILVLIIIFCFETVYADDWPQFRGLERNGLSQEKNLLKKWPKEGPNLLWSYEGVGKGFSSASIAHGFIYVTGVIDEEENLFAFDLKGNLKWKTSYGPSWNGSFPQSRTTPTVAGNKIYVNSGMGKVVCFEAISGKIKWSLRTIEKFDGEYHEWGIAESPLVVDNLVVCTPGGKNASIIALDANTGDLIWQSQQLSEIANYCSPILIERGGKKIIATQLEKSFVGIDAQTGMVLWQDQYSNYQDDPKDINIVSPIYHDGFIYVTSGYDDGSAMYQISQDGLSVSRLWVDQTLDNHMGGVVKVAGYIYGSNWENNRNGNWVCLDWNTGKVMYEKKWITKGSIISADGYLYCYEEKKGNLALVKAIPTEFKIISSFKVPQGSGQHWAHPSISNGRLYIRHGDTLLVYDIKAN